MTEALPNTGQKLGSNPQPRSLTPLQYPDIVDKLVLICATKAPVELRVKYLWCICVTIHESNVVEHLYCALLSSESQDKVYRYETKHWHLGRNFLTKFYI